MLKNLSGGARRWCLISVAVVTASALTACGSTVDADTGDDSNPSDGLALSAFTASQPGWNAVIPAFLASPQGAGSKIEPTYGSSGELSQAIVNGADADIVNFADEPSVSTLKRAEKVDANWNAAPTGGNPFGSVVVFVVRAGNPKQVEDWSDLLQPGLQVVTATPLKNGSGKWPLVAAYTVASQGAKDPAAGTNFLNSLILEHMKSSPGTGREATDSFVKGVGDVLLTTEANAIETQRKGAPIEIITPPQTMRVDNMVAVVSGGPHVDAATKLKDYLYTPAAQRLWARAGFRPVDPAVAVEFATTFPAPQKLWTIADIGGWRSIDAKFFDGTNGFVTKIFQQAMQ